MIQQAMQKNPGEQTVDVPALMFQLRKEPELIESGEEDEEWEIPRRNLGCIRWHGEFHAPKTMGKHKVKPEGYLKQNRNLVKKGTKIEGQPDVNSIF